MYSRRELYARGEPFGDSCTRREGGRVIYGGGGSSSSSSSPTTTTTQTTTQNTDKRIAIQDGIGISSDSSTVNVQALDGQIVSKALDTVAAADATAGDGFNKLLSLADKIISGAGTVVQSSQDTTLKQIESINAAAADSRGQIDQKTMIVIAVAGAAAYAFSKRKG